MCPESRREQLLAQSVGNEIVIYDERTHEAHRLSETAARVWQLADGERDLPALASALYDSIACAPQRDTAGLDDVESMELVRVALAELDRVGLLARAVPNLAVFGEPLSRRQMLGVSAALLPVVASIVAPTPAMATTCQATVSGNPTNVVANGGPVVVTIVTSCSWQATSLEGYITPTGPTSGAGPGTVTFNVGANSSVTARTGVINVTFPGNTNTATVTVIQSGASAAPPVAVISSPSSVMVNTVATFNGSGSQGSISSWIWDFGDTFTGSGPIVTHTYATNLLAPNSQTTLTVKLTVSGPGGSNAATKDITVFRTY
jgi:PKD domain-containing protein/all-beta uncharacterized protein/coenzyme PQQ synthesis protein D (PqqD)